MTGSNEFRHLVTIAVLTYRRPAELERCLDSVEQRLGDPDGSSGRDRAWRAAEILVIDNDPQSSARSVVSRRNPRHVERYVHEPEPGVAHARNRALVEATGRFLVFIDDDELAGDQWPDGLIDTAVETGAALVGGPVLTQFETPPPDWIMDGGFFDRPSHPHLSHRIWLRSGNLLIDLDQVSAAGLRFDPTYGQGEDVNFSRRAARAGLDLRWSEQGTVIEVVGSDRYTVEWRIERERMANRAWTRTELALDGSGFSVASVVARAGFRAAQGTVLRIRGQLANDPVTVIRGRSLIAQAKGRLDALSTDLTGRWGQRRALS